MRDRYTTDTYRQAVSYACRQARVSWSPNQLRHTAGTEIREEFGLSDVQLAWPGCDLTARQVMVHRTRIVAAPVSAAHLHRLLAINMSHDDLAAVAGEKLAADAAIARVDDGLDTIRTPAIVIQADRDRSVAPVHGRRLAASLARSRLVMVHGGHMTPYTHPGVIAGAIARHGDLLSAPERGRAPAPPRPDVQARRLTGRVTG